MKRDKDDKNIQHNRSTVEIINYKFSTGLSLTYLGLQY